MMPYKKFQFKIMGHFMVQSEFEFLIRSFAVKNSKDIFPDSFKNTKLFVELIWISSTSCQGHPINKLYFVCLIENGLKLKRA